MLTLIWINLSIIIIIDFNKNLYKNKVEIAFKYSIKKVMNKFSKNKINQDPILIVQIHHKNNFNINKIIYLNLEI